MGACMQSDTFKSMATLQSDCTCISSHTETAQVRTFSHSFKVFRRLSCYHTLTNRRMTPKRKSFPCQILSNIESARIQAIHLLLACGHEGYAAAVDLADLKKDEKEFHLPLSES